MGKFIGFKRNLWRPKRMYEEDVFKHFVEK